MSISPVHTAGQCALALMLLGPSVLLGIPELTLRLGDPAVTAALQTTPSTRVGLGVPAELGIVVIGLALTVALWAVFPSMLAGRLDARRAAGGEA